MTVRRYAEAWLEKRKTVTAAADKARLRKHALPQIGSMLIIDVKPRHLWDLVTGLRNAGKLAPCRDACRCILRDAADAHAFERLEAGLLALANLPNNPRTRSACNSPRRRTRPDGDNSCRRAAPRNSCTVRATMRGSATGGIVERVPHSTLCILEQTRSSWHQRCSTANHDELQELQELQATPHPLPRHPPLGLRRHLVRRRERLDSVPDRQVWQRRRALRQHLMTCRAH